MTDTSYDPRTYAIIGAAMEVHRVLGCGFLEPVYQKALAVEFSKRKIPYRRETSFPVFYKEVELDVPYRPDFICFDNVVVELKALAKISGIEQSQVINYLKVTGYELGLLLNFGTRSLDYRRFVLTNSRFPILTVQVLICVIRGSPYEEISMPASLTEEEFSKHVNTKFRARLDAEAGIDLELAEVKGYQNKAIEQTGMERFSVYFTGPEAPRLPQKTYTLQHDQMGEFEIFLVPISPNDQGCRYEAVFNYFK